MYNLVFILCLFPSIATATSLVNRYQFLSTSILPNDIWTFGISHGQGLGAGTRSYSSKGKEVSNQDYFSKDVTYSNLIDEINDPLEKNLAAAAFKVYEKDYGETAGRVVNDVTLSQSSDTYIIGRGFGDKSSLFIIFPVITLQTKFSSRFEHSPSLSSLAEQLRSEGQYRQAQEIINKSQDALRNKLLENGYRTNYPAEIKTLANIYLQHRYAAIESPTIKISADSSLIIPAGKKFDENDFLNLRINEEQYSLRQSFTTLINPHNLIGFLSSAYYHKRFSFEQSRRIPNNETSPLSKDIDQHTKTKYGDTWGGSAQVNISASESYLFYLGQSYEFKEKDSVSGSEYEDARYNYLEDGTSQRLGLGYVGLAFNTIQSFLSKKFPAPIDLNLQYSFTNDGKNVLKSRTIAMNLMVFYK
jgi:hypothetical protein